MTLDPATMQALVAEARVARLATVGRDGAPHVVPVCFALHDGRIVTAVDHKPKRTTALQRLADIAANPAVALLVDHYDDADWSALWWVRVDAHATITTEGPARDDAVDALVAKYRQYRAVRPEGPVVVATPTRWRGWAATPAGARAQTDDDSEGSASGRMR